MPRSEIQRQMKPGDFAELTRLILTTPMEIDDAHAWVRRRGVKTSRSAVGRLFVVIKQKSYSALRRQLRPGTDAAVRRQAIDWLHDLHGESLMSVAHFAAFILSGATPRTKRRRSRPRPTPPRRN